MYEIGRGLNSSDGSSFRRVARSPGLKDDKYRWPDNIVYYKIDHDLNFKEREFVKEILNKLNQKLDGCVQFKEQRVFTFVSTLYLLIK